MWRSAGQDLVGGSTTARRCHVGVGQPQLRRILRRLGNESLLVGPRFFSFRILPCFLFTFKPVGCQLLRLQRLGAFLIGYLLRLHGNQAEDRAGDRRRDEQHGDDARREYRAAVALNKLLRSIAGRSGTRFDRLAVDIPSHVGSKLVG